MKHELSEHKSSKLKKAARSTAVGVAFLAMSGAAEAATPKGCSPAIVNSQETVKIANQKQLQEYAGSLAFTRAVFNQLTQKMETVVIGGITHPLVAYCGPSRGKHSTNLTSGNYDFGYVNPSSHSPAAHTFMRFDSKTMRLIPDNTINAATSSTRRLIGVEFPVANNAVDYRSPISPQTHQPLHDQFGPLLVATLAEQ